MKRLATLCDTHNPSLIISLGDAFHDTGSEARMDDQDSDRLGDLIAAHDWLWILGNHDPHAPTRFGGRVEKQLRLDGLFFTHEPAVRPEPGEIAGHLHPCAKVKTATGSLRRSCFVSNENRMILPAFGAYTGGLNVLDEAFDPLFSDFTAWVIGDKAVYPIAPRLLQPDHKRQWQMAR